MVKRLFMFLLSIIVLLMIVIVVNTLRHRSSQLAAQPVVPLVIDAPVVSQRLAQALRFKTISSPANPSANSAEFARLRRHLEQSFPRLHASLHREIFGSNALLYRWEGTDPQALPIMLIAHQDVVPIAPETEQRWQHPPFAGVIKDGYIWGRGAWEDKDDLLAMMEAIETLLQQGFQPKQTIYLVFGHDEEVGGRDGAQKIAATLKARQVKFDYIIDEGMLMTEGMLPHVNNALALIGVAEKGYASVRLTVQATPGHSSMPPQKTAIGMMSMALKKLEMKQFPGHLHGTALDTFTTLAPEMNGINRVAMSNIWLFGPLIQRILQKDSATNALMRTTTALTMVQAGNQDNILPGTAEAIVNFRILPGENEQTVLDHVSRAIGNSAIKLQLLEGSKAPSAVSTTNSAGYRNINQTIRQVFPGTIVAPGLTLTATDSRHFSDLSDNIYRFSPMRARSEDLTRFHGTDERISIKNYLEMIQFYHQLILNTSKPL